MVIHSIFVEQAMLAERSSKRIEKRQSYADVLRVYR